MLNYKFTVFAKVESGEKTGMLNLCENYKLYFEECALCTWVQHMCAHTQVTIKKWQQMFTEFTYPDVLLYTMC